MHIDQIKTFLEVAATGNFNRAAERLNVTQSTVSARIRTLEGRLGRPLFERDHAGVNLTPAGERLRRHALNLQRLWQRAEQEVALPATYRGSVGLGAQASLWERLILRWIPWMRRQAPDVAIRAEADYSTSLARQVADGALDIGVVYTPGHRPGLLVEELFVEQLVLVSTNPEVDSRSWRSDYIFVDWGQAYNLGGFDSGRLGGTGPARLALHAGERRRGLLSHAGRAAVSEQRQALQRTLGARDAAACLCPLQRISGRRGPPPSGPAGPARDRAADPGRRRLRTSPRDAARRSVSSRLIAARRAIEKFNRGGE